MWPNEAVRCCSIATGSLQAAHPIYGATQSVRVDGPRHSPGQINPSSKISSKWYYELKNKQEQYVSDGNFTLRASNIDEGSDSTVSSEVSGNV